MYTLLELQSKTFGELKKIGDELNVLPEGDRRYRQTWIDAIAGVNPPLLQLLSVSAAVEVQAQEAIIETVETSPGVEPETPLESKFGRIVYPRPAQGAIELAPEASPAASVDRVQEPEIETSPLIKKNGLIECLNCEEEDGFVFDRWGDLVECPRCDGSKWVKISEVVQEAIVPVAEGVPGVEVEQIQEPIEVQAQEPYPRNARRDCPRCVGIQSLYWTRNFCLETWVIRCLYCDYERPKNPRFAHLAPPVYGPDEYPTYKEAIRQASAFQAPPPPKSTPGDYCCTWAPIAVPPTEPPPVKTEATVSQSAIVQAAEIDIDVEVDPVSESIVQAAEIDIDVEVDPVSESIVQAGPYSPGVDVDYIERQLQEPLLEASPGAFDCPFCGAQHGLFVTRDHIDRFVIRCLHCAYSRPKNYPGAVRTLAQESVLPSKSRGTFCKLAAKPIGQVAKTTTTGIEGIMNRTWTSWEKEYCSWLKGAEWCIHQGQNKRILAFLPFNKKLGLEGMRTAFKFCSIWEVSECTYDDDRNPLPVEKPFIESVETSLAVEVEQARDTIEHAVETSPGIDRDDDAPECSYCFDDGFYEEESGLIKFCDCCSSETKLSRQKTQSAIAPEADPNPILTGVVLSDRFVARYAPPQSVALSYEIADGYKADTDGQLSFLEVQVVTEPEPPDPDDFESLDVFREAIARWDREHPSSFDHCSDHLPSSVHCEPSSVPCQLSSVPCEPPNPEDFDSMFAFWAAYDAWDEASDDNSEPLEISLSSFCEWAPCPVDWYEPTALLEVPEVSELSAVPKSSITSDFFIPTFGRWGDRVNRSDEPPDTGIFARLPKPKPPTFPPQAIWTQVGHKSDTSQPKSAQVRISQSGIPKLSRNYPETIPKLFRVAAGSTQPARSPPGGDAS